MKKIILAAVLALSVLVLASCSSNTGESFPQASSASDLAQQTTATPNQSGEALPGVIDFDSGEYDPSSEEDAYSEDYDGEDDADTVDDSQTPAPTAVSISSEYAGATPLTIDPIDKPTPTPVPSVTLSGDDFTTYDATKLRISFDAPAGWSVDDSASDTYILTNPDERMAFPGQIIITVRSVSSSYSTNDLKREVISVRDSVKGDYDSFSPSNTANRTLFDTSGVYLDYTGKVKGTDVEVWGRIHVVCVNRSLVVVRITGPREYRSLYKDTIYPKFRSTVRFTR